MGTFAPLQERVPERRRYHHVAGAMDGNIILLNVRKYTTRAVALIAINVQ